MKPLSVVLVVVLGASSVLTFAQTTARRVRATMADSIGALARTKTLSELDAVWAHAPRDFPHTAVRAAMYARLGGVDSDAVLLKCLPTNGKEMEELYEAQDTAEGQDLAITEAYSTFYKRTSEAVARHPEHIPQFLRMIHAFNYIDNVDEWPWLCGLASTIYDKVPGQYMAAVKQLPQQYRKDALYCRKWPDAP